MNCISGIYSIREERVSQDRIDKMHDIDYMNNTKKEYYQSPKMGLFCCHPRGENLTRCFQLNSEDGGSLHIAFGGKIYNASSLWLHLKNEGNVTDDINKSDKSDSKLILRLYQKYGDDFLDHLNGKFAFAIWDEHRERLFCARDRFGIELLYYYRDNENFVFSSRILPILRSGFITPKPNIDRIYNFIERSNVSGEQTFFQDIFESPMGHFLTVEKDKFKLAQWYDISEHVVSLEAMKETEIVKRFGELFADSIKIRTDNNRKVCIALSGGIDSSYIVCLANNMKQRGLLDADIETISLRFNDPHYDEGEYIDAVLENVRTTHHNIFPDGSDLINTLTEIIKHFEEPFHKIHVPLFWELAENAEQIGISSILYGQGAESIIGGQSQGDYIMRIVELLNSGKLHQCNREIRGFSTIHEVSYARIFTMVLLDMLPLSRLLFRKLFRKGRFVVAHELANSKIKNFPMPKKFANRLAQSIFEDLYLQPYEFREFCKNKFDIDYRFPFMDHRLVEFAYSMPDNLKIDQGVSKIILRKNSEILPRKLRERTDKMMSANIMEEWFRTILKDYVLEIINSQSLKDRGIIDVDKVRSKVESHNKGSINIGKEIARWISVELWFRHFFDDSNLVSGEVK